MSEPTNNPPVCKGDCPGCLGGGHGPDGHRLPDEQSAGGLEGGRLAFAAAGAFLLPLGLAIAGAMLAQGSTERSLVGAGIGLATGVAIAAIAAKVWAKRQETRRQDQDQEQA